MPVTPFSSTGPSSSVQPSSPSRSWSSSQIRSSGHSRDVLVRPALHVEPAQLGRAQAEQREAALVVGVDELVVRRREPRRGSRASRTGSRARTCAARPSGMLGAADAVEAVAAGDHVALELLRLALLSVADPRALRGRGRARATSSTSKSSGAPCVEPRRDQVLDDLGLAVDHDAAPPVRSLSGMRWRSPSNWSSIPWCTSPSRRRRSPTPACVEQVDRALLEDAGADPVLDVLAAARLEDDRLDALQLQELRQRQTGRARADDADLRPDHSSPGGVEHALGDREGPVRGRDAAVDRAVQQHLLDLVGASGRSGAPRARASRARPRGRAR